MKQLIKYPKQSKISKVIDVLVDEKTIEYIKEFIGILTFAVISYVAVVLLFCL